VTFFHFVARRISDVDRAVITLDHFRYATLASCKAKRPSDYGAIDVRYSARHKVEEGHGARLGRRGPRRWADRARITGPALGSTLQTDRHRGYNGYVLEMRGRRILFGGDTANTDLFREARSMGPIDLAIMPIGAYNPLDSGALHSGGRRCGWHRRGCGSHPASPPQDLSFERRTVRGASGAIPGKRSRSGSWRGDWRFRVASVIDRWSFYHSRNGSP